MTMRPRWPPLFVYGFMAAGRASVAAADPLTLFAVGDWGGGSNEQPTTANQLNVAAAMKLAAEAHQPDAVMMMGDNFYLRGLSCDDEPNEGFDYAEVEAAHFDVVAGSFHLVTTESVGVISSLAPGLEAVLLGGSAKAALASDLLSLAPAALAAYGVNVTASHVRDVNRSIVAEGEWKVDLNLVVWWPDRNPASRNPQMLKQALRSALEAVCAPCTTAFSSLIGSAFGGSPWEVKSVATAVGSFEDRPCNQKHSIRFSQTFESVYDGPGLSSVPFYALSGNHDYYGYVRAQIAYGSDPPAGASGRWRYPATDPRASVGDGSVAAPWYSFDLYRESDGLSVLVIMTDSIKWNGLCSPYRGTLALMQNYGIVGCVPLGEQCGDANTTGVDYAPNGDGTFTMCHCLASEDGVSFDLQCAPRTEQELAKAAAHEDWFKRTLAGSAHDWIVVAGHYPIWSIAEHGPTPALVEELRPYLYQYGAAVYLNGHDHNAQHIVETRTIAAEDKSTDYVGTETFRVNDPSSFAGPFTADQMHFITVGAGSPIDTDHHRTLQADTHLFKAEGSFAQLSFVDKHTANVKILGLNTSGQGVKELHSFVMDNPRRKGSSAADQTGGVGGFLYGSLACNAALLLGCLAWAVWMRRRSDGLPRPVRLGEVKVARAKVGTGGEMRPESAGGAAA